MLSLLITAAIIGILVFLLFKRMPLELLYAYSANHNKQAFKVKVCGINVIRDKQKKSSDNKDKKSEGKDKGEKVGFSEFMKKLSWVKDVYKTFKDEFLEILKYLGKKTRIKNFTINLDMGFEDAAHTGIAAGAAYAVVYSAASLVYNNLSIKKEDLDIEVNPRFDKQCVDLYVKSIFSLSVVHIIRVLIMLLKINKEIKKSIKQ